MGGVLTALTPSSVRHCSKERWWVLSSYKPSYILFLYQHSFSRNFRLQFWLGVANPKFWGRPEGRRMVPCSLGYKERRCWANCPCTHRFPKDVISDHNPRTSQTDRRTTCDRKTALCTKVHCAVKTKSVSNLSVSEMRFMTCVYTARGLSLPCTASSLVVQNRELSLHIRHQSGHFGICSLNFYQRSSIASHASVDIHCGPVKTSPILLPSPRDVVKAFLWSGGRDRGTGGRIFEAEAETA